MRHHVLFALVFVLSASPAFTQEIHSSSGPSLKIPTTVFLAAASADWVSTGVALSQPGFTERNPMLAFTRSNPAGTVAALVASDLVGAWVINRFVAPRKPTLAKVLLYSFAAARVGMAMHNARSLRR